MIHIGVRQIPARYILKRWTKDARDNMPDHLKCYQKDASIQVSKTFMHNIMYIKALEIVKLADRGVVTFQPAIMAFDKVKNDLEKIIAAEITKEQASNDQGNAGQPSKEPTQETTRGFKENQTTPTTINKQMKDCRTKWGTCSHKVLKVVYHQKRDQQKEDPKRSVSSQQLRVHQAIAQGSVRYADLETISQGLALATLLVQ